MKQIAITFSLLLAVMLLLLTQMHPSQAQATALFATNTPQAEQVGESEVPAIPPIPDEFVDESLSAVVGSLIDLIKGLVVGFGVLIIGLAVGLYRSVPPALQGVIKELAQGSLAQGEKYVSERLRLALETPNPYDDKFYQSLTDSLKSLSDKLDKAFPPNERTAGNTLASNGTDKPLTL